MLPTENLPGGFGEVFKGSLHALSLIIPAGATYDVSYRNLETGAC